MTVLLNSIVYKSLEWTGGLGLKYNMYVRSTRITYTVGITTDKLVRAHSLTLRSRAAFKGALGS